jgi:two-component sensor histidine kinase
MLTWSEHGGPPVQAPSELGFGSRLIEMSVTRQLSGTLDYDWRADGLRVSATIPSQTMAR